MFFRIQLWALTAICISCPLLAASSTSSKVRKASAEARASGSDQKTTKKNRPTARVRSEAKPVEVTEEPAATFAPPSIPATVTVPSTATNRYRKEFSSGLGLFLLDQAAVSLNMQMRFSVSRKSLLYAGVDGTYGLFTNGSYFGLLPAVWWDFVLQPIPLAHLSLGVLGGVGFTRGLPALSPSVLALFGELSIAFEVDDLSTVRGQFRPGIVGGRFAFSMLVLLGFRFR
jgi:hypothetical protein